MAVRGPAGIPIFSVVVGKPGLPRSVSIHDVDLEVAVAVTDKDDLGAIRGPVGLPIFSVVVGKPGLSRSISIHDVDLWVAVAVTLEGDFAVYPKPIVCSCDKAIGGY